MMFFYTAPALFLRFLSDLLQTRNIFKNRITKREAHLPFCFIVSVVRNVSLECFFSVFIC